MLSSDTARAAARDAFSDPLERSNLGGLAFLDTVTCSFNQDGVFVDPRIVGIDLSQCDEALLQTMPAVCHAATYARLFALGVRGLAITGGSTFAELHVDAVVFLDGNRFEFARDMSDATGHVLAILIPAIDENGETIDVAAWIPETGALATWRGAACILGENQIEGPRLDSDGLHVFATPLEWLLAQRRGVVILDAERARWRLAEERIIVAEPNFGRRVRSALRLPEPKVFVERRTA